MYGKRTMTRRRTPTSTQPLPALDTHGITADAEAWVAERLADVEDPPEVILAASKIIKAQRRPMETLRMQRDQLALSIREYGPDAVEPVRRKVRNVRLAEAAGVSRARLQTLRDLWPEESGPPPLIPNARRDLPKIAKRAYMHEARIEAARRARDTAAKQLFDAGWKNADIARLMGRDPSRAAHLRARVKALETVAS